MIKFNRLKAKYKRNELENELNRKSQTSSYIRLTKDINDLNLPKTCQIDFPNQDDLTHFILTVTPDEGFYQNCHILFDFRIDDNYPYEPPKVKCETEIYHPNIDLDGSVCLNILREDWKPVLTIDSIVYGLLYLLMAPNPKDPLNKSAASELETDRKSFAMNVKRVAYGKVSARSLCQHFNLKK